jgi:hypothetical protein
VSAIDWGKHLLASCIRSTVVRLPVNGLPGLRFGVQELTRMGMGASEMEQVAEIIARILLRGDSESRVAIDVAELSEAFATPQFISEPTPAVV